MAVTITNFSGGEDVVTPSNSLVDAANFLYSLCGKMAPFARNLISEGGQVASVSPSSFVSIADFYVTDETYIVAGQSSKVISEYIGYDLLFIRNGVPQTTANLGGGESYFTWNKSTGSFFCFPAAIGPIDEETPGELFQLKAVL